MQHSTARPSISDLGVCSETFQFRTRGSAENKKLDRIPGSVRIEPVDKIGQWCNGFSSLQSGLAHQLSA
jgi:hypothetical protein